jgi:flagellar motor switch protein FliN
MSTRDKKTNAPSPSKNGATPSDAINLDFVLDIPLQVTVELGRTQMVVSELLKLSQGAIVELTKPAGQTLDILANRQLIARGEVVVGKDKYAVRITEIVSPRERVEKLK